VYIGARDLARVAQIGDPYTRAAGVRKLTARITAAQTAERRLRDALIYAGIDQFDTSGSNVCEVYLRPDTRRVCVPASFPGAVPCPRPHKALGLCELHHQAWHGGRAWGAGGLELAAAPRSKRVAWRRHAIEISGICNTVFNKAEVLRIYPAAGGGWTQDPAQWDRTQQGYWIREPHSRRQPQLVVHELPAVQLGLSDTAHWRKAGQAHTRLLKLMALERQLADEVRNPTMRHIMRTEPSNVALAPLFGLNEQFIAQMRRVFREAGQLTAA
jgi:hypothetical protein